MKGLSLSICALAGALMASIGTYAENMEGARRINHVDSIGIWIVIICVGLTIVLSLRRSRKNPDD